MLADCIAPDIQGERERTIRKAASLQLFRGVRSQKPNGNWVRGDIHILQLGDPSTGKSQVLRAVQRIAPRSAFASGKGASAAGMTAAGEPDNFGDSEWSLEAGALVLANKGIACIDEIDKVKEDAISSMHDALEAPQEVAINKAGINTSLPTQTAVLAGGNPKYGRFNPYEPIGEQFEIGPTLLSRFDLIFTLEDTPERERDRRVGSTVTETRQNAHRYTHHREEMTDKEIQEQELPVDIEVLRAWIAYARQEVYPVIGPELQSKIVDAYVNFRNDINSSSNSDVDPIPLTARKIDAIQRLVEASARVGLREEATEADLQRATQKIRQSLEDVGRDPETGEFDADMVEAGASRSQQQRMETLEELIKQIGGGDPARVDDVLSKASDAGIDISTAENEIQKLADHGDIIKYPNGDGEEVAEWIQ